MSYLGTVAHSTRYCSTQHLRVPHQTAPSSVKINIGIWGPASQPARHGAQCLCAPAEHASGALRRHRARPRACLLDVAAWACSMPACLPARHWVGTSAAGLLSILPYAQTQLGLALRSSRVPVHKVLSPPIRTHNPNKGALLRSFSATLSAGHLSRSSNAACAVRSAAARPPPPPAPADRGMLASPCGVMLLRPRTACEPWGRALSLPFSL